MISYRRLKPTQFEEWIDHCANVFASNENEIEHFRDYFRRHFLNDPDRDISTIFVALDDDKIVGSVRLFKRKIYLDGNIIDAGGIGEVGVNPNYQKKGIATNLLNLAFEDMHNLNINLSFLFASRHSFYNRLGYELVSYNYYKTKVIKSEQNVKYKLATMLDFETLTDLYNNYASKLNGPIYRNLFYFENWVKAELNDIYLILNEDDETVGYISGYTRDDSLIIKDFAIKDGYNFIDITNHFASIYFKDYNYVSYPSMHYTPSTYEGTRESPHLMIKVLSPLSDKIQNTNDLKDYLLNSRYGYYETDNF